MSLAEFIYTTVFRPAPLRALANFGLKTIARPSVRIDDAVVMLNPDDPVISGALTLGVYENDEIAFIRKICKPNMTVLDIGANVGLYTAVCGGRTSPDGRIIAVEPDPTNFQYLQKTVAANPGMESRVTLIQAVAGTAKGEATLFRSAANKGDHRLYMHEFTSDGIAVHVIALDDVLMVLGVGGVDFIKIDVQGFEFHAIQGLQKTIDASPALVMLSEFWPKGLKEAGSDPTEYLDWLRARGFSLRRLEKGGDTSPIENEEALISSLPGRKYCNIVAIKGEKERL